MRAAFFLLFVGLPACAAAPPGLTYRVHAGPEMTANQISALTAALEDWHAHVSDLEIYRDVADCDGSRGIGDVCIHMWSRAQICADEGLPPDCPNDGRTVASADGGDIRIDAALDGDVLQGVLAHELGHAFGIDWHAPSGSGQLMTKPLETNHVTPADVKDFWKVRP